MSDGFFALAHRMKYIERWSLMRNTARENIAEHSFFVALISHALAAIRRDVYEIPCDPTRAVTYAVFHDMSEIFTGDLPTPIKYYNPKIRTAYHEIEEVSKGRLLAALPDELQGEYRAAANPDEEYSVLVKAADKLSAYIKCIEERNAGNAEFIIAERQTLTALTKMAMPEIDYFIEHFIPSFSLTLDELER
ncbi:MAG: 5'-deoxynucleotidase [Clostridia bacterium]